MTIKPTSKRHVTTLLFLLRYYADQQRRMHGPMVERPGGIELTPSEMEAWADEIEADCMEPVPQSRLEVLRDARDSYTAAWEFNAWAREYPREAAELAALEAEALPGNSAEGWLDT